MKLAPALALTFAALTARAEAYTVPDCSKHLVGAWTMSDAWDAREQNSVILLSEDGTGVYWTMFVDAGKPGTVLENLITWTATPDGATCALVMTARADAKSTYKFGWLFSGADEATANRFAVRRIAFARNPR